MARLPDTYGARPTPQPGRGIASYDASAVPRAVAGLGRVVGDISEQVTSEHKQMEQAKQRADAALALAKVNNDLYDAHDEIQRGIAGGEVPADKADEVLQVRLGEIREKGLEGLNDQQRQAVADNVENTVGGLRRSMAGVVFKRRQSEVAGAIDQFGEQVQRDVPRLGPQWAAEKFNAFVDFNGGIAGLSSEQQAKVKQSFKEGVNFTHIQGLGADAYKAGDASALAGVRKLLKSNDVLDPAKKTQLDNQLFVYENTLSSQSERNKKEAEAKEEKRLKDAKSASETLQKFVASGAPMSADYQLEVMHATQGTPFEVAAKVMIVAASKGAGFGSQSLPAQAASLRALEAQTVTAGTSPETQIALQYLRTINDNQSREYKENPWAAATRFARLPEQKEEPIAAAESVPQLVSKRVPLMNDVEAMVGAEVSPLQPSEATAFSSRLMAMPPDKRAEVLGQTGSGLSLGRVNALAEQLDKANKPLALALKLGVDRTTAGRVTSALVLRGAQALADKAVKRDDAALTGWKSEISALVRGSLGDDQAEQDVIDAAYYVRAAMDAEGSAVPGFNLTASNRNAVTMVVGEPLDRGGVKTILPRGVSEDAFTDKLRAMTPDVLRSIVSSEVVYVRGQPRTVEQLSSALPSIGMKRDGNGRYIPSTASGFVTIDQAGTVPLALEMR